jgi:hypothetical protein
MAIEAWLRLPQPRTADDPVLLDFVDLALAEGEPDLRDVRLVADLSRLPSGWRAQRRFPA